MHSDAIEIIDYDGEGFKPLMAFENWRVAGLNSGPGCAPDRQSYQIERHLETDEVFVLTRGQAWLLLCGNGEFPGPCEILKLENGVVVNVRQNTWHGTVMAPDSRILLVEKRDTGSEADTVRVPLDPADQETARAEILRALAL